MTACTSNKTDEQSGLWRCQVGLNIVQLRDVLTGIARSFAQQSCLCSRPFRHELCVDGVFAAARISIAAFRRLIARTARQPSRQLSALATRCWMTCWQSLHSAACGARISTSRCRLSGSASNGVLRQESTCRARPLSIAASAHHPSGETPNNKPTHSFMTPQHTLLSRKKRDNVHFIAVRTTYLPSTR